MKKMFSERICYNLCKYEAVFQKMSLPDVGQSARNADFTNPFSKVFENEGVNRWPMKHLKKCRKLKLLQKKF